MLFSAATHGVAGEPRWQPLDQQLVNLVFRLDEGVAGLSEECDSLRPAPPPARGKTILNNS